MAGDIIDSSVWHGWRAQQFGLADGHQRWHVWYACKKFSRVLWDGLGRLDVA